MRHLRLLTVLMTATIVAACSGSPEPLAQAPAASPTAPAAAADAGGRKYLLERVGDAAVVQLYADGFAALPPREKALIYHLSQAAIAGRDIFYDQKHRHSLEMRRTLEAILTHPQGIDPAALAAIEQYTKLFWINNGPYN